MGIESFRGVECIIRLAWCGILLASVYLNCLLLVLQVSSTFTFILSGIIIGGVVFVITTYHSSTVNVLTFSGSASGPRVIVTSFKIEVTFLYSDTLRHVPDPVRPGF